LGSPFARSDQPSKPALYVKAPRVRTGVVASVIGRNLGGSRLPGAPAGVTRVGEGIDSEDFAFPAGSRCAHVSGVHANVSIPARDRVRLERLCRYCARPAVATERLSVLPDGRLLYRLKRRWRDGTSHVIFESIELVEKLASLVPPPGSTSSGIMVFLPLPRGGDRASFLRTPLPAISFLTLAALARNSILVPRRRVPTSDAAVTLGTTHGPNSCAECSLWTFWNALAVLAGCALWQPSILQEPLAKSWTALACLPALRQSLLR
jgi:Putative transposase